MKTIIKTSLALAVVVALSFLFTDTASAQTGTPKGQGLYFVDQDGDGICDNIGTRAGQKSGNAIRGKGNGPKDGTGFRAGGGNGTGVCDGTGPKGNMNRSGRK